MERIPLTAEMPPGPRLVALDGRQSRSTDGIRPGPGRLHAVGVRGVQMFEGGMGTPLVVPEPGEHGSPAWHAAVRLAAETAQRLELEFAVATSPGWSAAGGPWVEPAEAMKKVAWRPTLVDGGGPVDGALPPLWTWPVHTRTAHGGARIPTDTGTPGTGSSSPFPPTGGRRPLIAVRSVSVDDSACLIDGSLAGTVLACRGTRTDSSTAWIEQVFDQPVRVAAVTVGLPGPRGFGRRRPRTRFSRPATTASLPPGGRPARPRPCRAGPSPSSR